MRPGILLGLAAALWSGVLAAADNDLAAQVARLTRTVLDQEQKLMRLEADVRQLRGDMELILHNQEQSTTSKRNLYADLDERLRKLEKAARAAPTPPAPVPAAAITPPAAGGTVEVILPETAASPPPQSSSPPPVAQDERGVYQQAFNMIQAGQYRQAIEGFKILLQQYPQGEYADNAQYWLAESYYALSDFRSAQAEFQRLIENYPTSAKLSHAQLKLGYTYYELNQKMRAKEILEQVRLKYPGTSTARLAEERLRRLRVEGY